MEYIPNKYINNLPLGLIFLDPFENLACQIISKDCFGILVQELPVSLPKENSGDIKEHLVSQLYKNYLLPSYKKEEFKDQGLDI